MKLPAFLNNLSAPKWMLLHPMLIISLVLHGVVLMLPMPSDKQNLEPPKKEAKVKITKLPLSSKSFSQASSKSSQKPTPQLTSQGSQENLPPSPQKRQTNPPQIVINRPVPQTNFPQIVVTETVPQINSSPNKRINQQSVTSDESQIKPQQKPTTSKDSNQESPNLNQDSKDSNQESPNSNQDSKDSNQESPNSNQGPTSAQKIRDFFSTFPRYPRAEKGSGGVLRPEFDNATYIFHTEDNLETVASKFEKKLLPNQNFASPKPVNQEDNFKVYEVSNSTGLETNYLYLISQNGKTAIYVEKENYTVAQLIEAQTEDRNNDVFETAVSIAIEVIKRNYDLADASDTDRDKLVEKDRFPREKFDFKMARKTKADKPVETSVLASSLNEQLRQLDPSFEPLSSVGKYGGGLLYKLKKGEYETYLVLAPAKDEQDRPITVIVLSKNKPS